MAVCDHYRCSGMHEPYPSRVIVADGSCGGFCIVPRGEDMYDALDTAHRAHVKLMREGC
jgi:hypothetical protein